MHRGRAGLDALGGFSHYVEPDKPKMMSRREQLYHKEVATLQRSARRRLTCLKMFYWLVVLGLATLCHAIVLAGGIYLERDYAHKKAMVSSWFIALVQVLLLHDAILAFLAVCLLLNVQDTTLTRAAEAARSVKKMRNSTTSSSTKNLQSGSPTQTVDSPPSEKEDPFDTPLFP